MRGDVLVPLSPSRRSSQFSSPRWVLTVQKGLVKGGPSSLSSHLKQDLVQAVAASKTATAASYNQLLD